MTLTNKKAIEILNALAWVQGGPDREEIITAISMAIEALADRPIGEWIEDKHCDRHCICSNCGGSSGTQFDGVQPIPRKTKFCPNCGAKMLNIDSEKITKIGE